MKIGIDLDDTINQLVPEWIKRYNAKHNDTLAWTAVTDWNIAKFVKCGNGIYDFIREDGLFSELAIQPFASEQILKLSEDNEIFIVSAYVPEACRDKARWVQRNLPFINDKNIIFCNHKNLLNLDILIDDSPLNHKGFNGEYVVFNMPWNSVKEYPELKDFERAYDWNEVYEIIAEIELTGKGTVYAGLER